MKNSIIRVAVTCLVFIPAALFGQKPQQASGKTVQVYVTAAKSSMRLHNAGLLQFKPMGQPLETQPCVFVDPAHQFQTMVGIGGALTDASAEVFARLPAAKKQEFLKAYYNPQSGIGYTLGRTTIHSCDFSSGTYTYIDEGDKDLKSFSIEHDRQYRIPFIKQVIAAAGGKLTMFVSPWSPPAFMKDNNDILHGGKLKKEFYKPWANYYVKFIKAYEKEGIPVWGLSIQNEPMATQRWESCIYSDEDETDFLKTALGPTLQQQGLASKKLIIWDHNRDLLFQRANTLLSDPAAAKYVWGVGFHWYESWSGGDPVFDNVKKVAEAFPSKNLIFTEGCNEKFEMARINDWKLGERYGLSMINDFNNGTCAWTDWNVLLDENGGPNHVGNFCFAPVHANVKTGDLIFTNAYYYIGHFSKFIRPGAKRISCSGSRSPLVTTAFKNTNGSIAVVVMNPTDNDLDFALWMNGNAAQTKSAAHSIITMVVK